MKVAARRKAADVVASAFSKLNADAQLFTDQRGRVTALDQHARAVVVGCLRELCGLSFPEIQRSVARKRTGHSSRVRDWSKWCALDWRERFGWLQMIEIHTRRFA